MDKKRRAFSFNFDELEALILLVEERKPHLFGKVFFPMTFVRLRDRL